jgi:HD-GYP domain-containing protein (c-di-GMP phosphodiesterase class II)
MAISKETILNIGTTDLKIGMFVILPRKWFRHPFIRNHFKLSSTEEIKKIRNAGIEEVYVDLSKSSIEQEKKIPTHVITAPKTKKPEEIVPKELINVIRRKDIPAQTSSVAVKKSSLILMNNLLENPSSENINQAKQGIYEIVDFIISDDETSNCLLSITNHDLYTYTHSVNVGFLSLLLAKRLFRGSNLHNLRELGASFFLHDLGKVNINSDIINKTAKLNPKELLLVRQHPTEGAKILEKSHHLSNEAKIIVMQHHERDDGSGYPNRLKGKQIHLYARICSIADVYDALTSERSYKKRLLPFNALELMRDEMIHHFQRDLFEQFVLLFAKS